MLDLDNIKLLAKLIYWRVNKRTTSKILDAYTFNPDGVDIWLLKIGQIVRENNYDLSNIKHLHKIRKSLLKAELPKIFIY